MQVKFSRLPRRLQERIKEMLQGEGEIVVVNTAVSNFSYLATALALLWLVILYFLTDDFLWDTGRLVIFSLMTVAAIYFLVLNLYRLFRRFTARSFLLFTHGFILDIAGNTVDIWRFDELLSVLGAHDYQNGKYRATKFTLTFENSERKFEINNIEAADDASEKISYLKKCFIEGTVRKDREYLDSIKDFSELERGRKNSALGRQPIVLQVFVSLVSLILSAGIIYGAVILNRYFDDKNSWAAARLADRAKGIRNYRETHPQGRWVNDADQRLQFLYDAAEQKYKASLSEGYDQKTADEILAVMKYARDSANFHVKVAFERHNDVPPDIEEQLKKDFEVTNVLPLGDTLSDEKMARREKHLLTRVTTAFRQIIPDDILEFSTDCPGECVNFLVKYAVKAGDSIYYDDKDKKLPPQDRVYNPGIFIDWDFRIHIPNQAEDYTSELESIPAQHISYDDIPSDNDLAGESPVNSVPLDVVPNGTNASSVDSGTVVKDSRGNFYDSMVVSAFDDFQANLVYQMGIGDDKKLNVNQAPIEDPLADDKNKTPAR